MSRKAEVTRERIVRAARDLLEHSEGEVPMAAVAERAGVTRQLLYVHFEGRSDLLLAVVRAVDAEVRTADLQELVESASTGRGALHAAVAAQGRIKPRIDGLVTAIDRARLRDPAAAEAWAEREGARLLRFGEVVARLQRESLLRPEWNVADAGRLGWSATSQHAWQALVRDGDWSTEEWVEHTAAMLDLALCLPDEEP